eukprot:scaffold2585_cov368-Prasinococcus_capsulatus_cf.AAC.13
MGHCIVGGGGDGGGDGAPVGGGGGGGGGGGEEATGVGIGTGVGTAGICAGCGIIGGDSGGDDGQKSKGCRKSSKTKHWGLVSTSQISSSEAALFPHEGHSDTPLQLSHSSHVPPSFKHLCTS